MKSVRDLNGYRVVYAPGHPTAMRSKNWDGYVYEHIFVVERALKRSMRHAEIVHHLDGNRANNRLTNLLVLERSQHVKLHIWLDAGAPFAKADGAKVANSGKAKADEPRRCKACGAALQGSQRKSCSYGCAALVRRKANRPDMPTLAADIAAMSWLAIGRKYGVSDNAARKWARQYGLLGQP